MGADSAVAELDETLEPDPPTKPGDVGRQIAVAVRDTTNAGERPKVVAKGHGKLADQILNIAFDQGIKVRSDADLAEILAAVDVDSEVPLEALAAVSEILTYVYQATREGPTEARPGEHSPPDTETIPGAAP